MMIFKLWHKLALILILGITTAVVISTALSRQSFNTSFIEYIEQQEHQRLKNLAGNLLERYESEGNWGFIRNKQRIWLFYLRLKPETQPEDKRFNDRQTRRQMRQNRMAFRQERELIHALPGDNKRSKINQLRNKYALLDENKQLIVGASFSDIKRAKDKIGFYPLQHNGQLVAYIQYRQFSGLTSQLDKIFANKQDQAFLYNALSALFISLLVALIVSMYFQKRIKALTQIAKELTSGHYQQRVTIKQKDELGQLGRDFNQLAETLEKNQQSQQQWIADISHELRTPLAILKGELQALDDGIRPLNQEAVESLQQEAERLSALVEDLYQLSVADMGALKYEKQAFNVSQWLDEIEGNFSLQFNEKKLIFSVSSEVSQSYMLNADKQRLYQLLSNLLQNSLQYTDPGGQVQLSCHEEGSALRISLSDSSPGLESKQLSQIFERLFRVDSSRSRAKGGAGLGLAIAKQIVLAHQGKIFAQASELGGITMTIVLPKNE